MIMLVQIRQAPRGRKGNKAMTTTNTAFEEIKRLNEEINDLQLRRDKVINMYCEMSGFSYDEMRYQYMNWDNS